MRELLAPLVGQRRRFRAVVAALGVRPDGALTVCLREVADGETGRALCDHAWIAWPRSVGRARVLPGWPLTFVAVVRPYRHAGTRQGGCGYTDYQLTALRQVRNC